MKEIETLVEEKTKEAVDVSLLAREGERAMMMEQTWGFRLLELADGARQAQRALLPFSEIAKGARGPAPPYLAGGGQAPGCRQAQRT